MWWLKARKGQKTKSYGTSNKVVCKKGCMREHTRYFITTLTDDNNYLI